MSNPNSNPVQTPNSSPNPVLSPTLATGSTSEQTGSFTCKACGESFNSQDERQKHNEDQHSGK